MNDFVTYLPIVRDIRDATLNELHVAVIRYGQIGYDVIFDVVFVLFLIGLVIIAYCLVPRSEY
jgi:hypothetical protein